MESTSSFGEIKDALHKHGGAELSDATWEPLIRELWVRATESTPIADVRFETAEDVAFAFVDKLQLPSAAVDFAAFDAGLTAEAHLALRRVATAAAHDPALVVRAEAARTLDLARATPAGAAQRLVVVPFARAQEPAQHHAQCIVAAA